MEAQHLGRHATGDLGGVGDENHRSAQQLGQLGGRALFGQAGMPVEDTHDTFHHGDISAGAGPLE